MDSAHIESQKFGILGACSVHLCGIPESWALTAKGMASIGGTKEIGVREARIVLIQRENPPMLENVTEVLGGGQRKRRI